MYRLMWAVAIAIAMTGGVATAMEIPLSPAAARAAVVAGLQQKGIPAAYAAGGEWLPKADAEAPAPVGTSLTVETPFELLYFVSAEAAAQYREPDPQAIEEAIAMRTLDLDMLIFSDRVSANDGARLVIRQDGKIIQPVKNSVNHSSPTDRFWQHVHASFDSKKLNLSKPMTVILANAMIASEYQRTVTEVRYTIDPTAIR
ncbi:MAG: hypothetical protein JWM87_658 [Candidatus Eremiobacteraeota bacterium]|nr:hypothetical protein [Candidatus Eremiobacteraeota bacterium]